MLNSRNFGSANSTDKDDVEVDVFFAFLLPTLGLIAILLNSATILAFWRLARLREKPSELLILNLSFSDLLTGLAVIPLWSPVYITPAHWPLGENGCRVAILFLNMGIHGSLFAVLSISIDRFMLISMEYPRYVYAMTRKRVKLVIAAIWLLGLVTVAIEMGLWDVAKVVDKDAATIDYTMYCLSPPRRLLAFSVTFFLCFYMLPVIIVCVLSIAFLYLLHKRIKRGEEHRLRSHSQRSSQMDIKIPPTQWANDNLIPRRQLRKRYIRPAFTLIALVSAMACCMIPYCLYVIITDFMYECPTCQNVDILYNLLLLQFCNACLDPFLYAMTKKKIRKFYQSSWKAFFKKPEALN